MKHLLIVDDKLIRKAAFSNAEKIIKKIDRLDSDLQSFRDQDQRLFSNWFDLTFRNEREQIMARHEEYRALAKFHNWIIAEAKIRDISLPAALLILRQEEERYARSSENERTRIDEARKSRDEFIRSEVEKEFGPGASSDFDEAEEEFPEDDDSSLSPEEAQALDSIRQMTDKKIQKICKDHDAAFTLLASVLGLARSDDDHALFLRIWDLVPHKHQVSFAKSFAKDTGHSLNKLIEEIREHLEDRDSADIQGEAQDDDEGFSEDFIGARSSAGKQGAKRVTPEETERIKLLYRKLVRHLHPDLQDQSGSQSHWQKKIWDRVQTANKRLDQRELEKLFRLVLIRSRCLNELTIGEIIESQNWLKEEFENLSQEAKGLKKLPAWGFSRKKDYGPLKRKLSKPIAEELDAIDDQIMELKSQHAFLEMMARSQPERGTNNSRRRKRKPRAKSRPHGRGSSSQTSFFD